MRKFDCIKCGAKVTLKDEVFEETFAELWGAKDYCSEKCYLDDKMEIYCQTHNIKMEFISIENPDGSYRYQMKCPKCSSSYPLGGWIPYHEVKKD